MKRLLILILTLLFATISITAINRKSLADYASSLSGLNKSELKTAVYNLIYPNSVLEYGSGAGSTWFGFYTTDRIDSTNECIDRYSNDIWYFSNQGNAIAGMNIEHSFPKSWWGGALNNAYKDLYNLMPCQSSINSAKNNYGMGIVSKTTTDNGCTKVGKGTTTGTGTSTLWEPADKWKGDFARGYMYMVTAYQYLYTNYEGQALISLEQDEWPTLKQWAYKLYIAWGKTDMVSQTEVDRNNAVYAIQHNRNIFIDFPNLAEYIWGDSINIAFDPTTSLTTCYDDNRYGEYNYTIDGSDDQESKIILTDFKQSQGDFTVNIISKDKDLPSIWKQTSNYGMKATAYYNSTNYAAEAWLVSPEIDLTNFHNCTLIFSEIVNKYFSDVDTEATVWIKVSDNGDWIQLPYSHPTPSGTWSDSETKTIDISEYDGQKVYIGFKYVSTMSAGTWEIQNFSVNGTKITSSISIPVENLSPNNDFIYYNLSGQRIDRNYKGLVINNGRKFYHK